MASPAGHSQGGPSDPRPCSRPQACTVRVRGTVVTEPGSHGGGSGTAVTLIPNRRRHCHFSGTGKWPPPADWGSQRVLSCPLLRQSSPRRGFRLGHVTWTHSCREQPGTRVWGGPSAHFPQGRGQCIRGQGGPVGTRWGEVRGGEGTVFSSLAFPQPQSMVVVVAVASPSHGPTRHCCYF